MAEEQTIELWEAIRQMRKLTSLGKSFSFVHSTWNEDKQSCEGIRSVGRARLRSAGRMDQVARADEKLFYYDEILGEPRQCYQVLVLFFNEMKCILN